MKALEVAEGKPARMTIALDAGKGETPREMSFTVGGDGKAGEFDRFKLGYAGTIYKAQGDTLDQAYMLHSAGIKNATSYVGLTRHRGDVKMFVSRETLRRMDRARKIFPRGQADAAADIARALDIMAAGMGRQQNKRSAASYFIDEAVEAWRGPRGERGEGGEAGSGLRRRVAIYRDRARERGAKIDAAQFVAVVRPRCQEGRGARDSPVIEEEAGNNASHVAEGSRATAAGTERTARGPPPSTTYREAAREINARAGPGQRLHLRQLFHAVARQVLRPLLSLFDRCRGRRPSGATNRPRLSKEDPQP